MTPEQLSTFTPILLGGLIAIVGSFFQFLWMSRNDERKRKWQKEDEKKALERTVRDNRLAQIEAYVEEVANFGFFLCRHWKNPSEDIYEANIRKISELTEKTEPIISLVFSIDTELGTIIESLDETINDYFYCFGAYFATSDVERVEIDIKMIEHQSNFQKKLSAFYKRLDKIRSM
jgi:uncharacterized protein YutD